MNSDNGGCFGCLGALIVALCVLAYPFYDAYCGRSLDNSDVLSLKLDLSIVHWDASSSYVKVTRKSTEQEWLFESAEITLYLKLKSGGQKQVVVRKSDLAGGSFSPESTTYPSSWFKLPNEDARLLREGQVAEWSWWMTDSKARRKPIKLVKIISGSWKWLSDSATGLFERS